MSRVLIDGATGEGGGQILRTSLSLSAITGKPFKMVNVRAKRAKPGLKRQHLTCLKADAEICGAEVEGAEVGSMNVSFKPGKIVAGKYRFEVGTAGSVTLVAQTVLPILLCADGESEVVITGGTHVPMSPCWEYFAKAYLPQVRAMGAEVEARLVKHGFYPAGGGEIVMTIKPWCTARPYELVDRGQLQGARVIARVANLHPDIATTEVDIVTSQLRCVAFTAESGKVESVGPGNYCAVALSYGNVNFVTSEIGTYDRSRRAVANGVVSATKTYLGTGCAADVHLSDQILLPIVLAGDRIGTGVCGRFTMPGKRSLHFDTNWDVIGKFKNDVALKISDVGEDGRQIEIKIEKICR